MLNKIQNFSIIIFLIIGFILGLGFSVFAWTNPSQNPPNGGGLIQTSGGNLVIPSGNIGIGTTNPQAKLDIVGTGGSPSGISTFPARITSGINTNSGFISERSDASKFASLWTGSSLAVLGFTDTHTRLAIGTYTYANRYSTGAPNTEIMSILPNGNVGIGTTAPGYKLDVAGDIRTSGCLVYNGGTLGTCVSDINLKNIIGPFKVDNALDKITRFNPVRYTFKKDPLGQVLVGLVAQEVEQFAPEFVTETEEGKQIKYGEIQWLQIEAIKELKKENEELRSRIIHLEQEIQELKNK